VLLLLLLQVAMIGSGAWACAAMHIVAQNCLAYDVADEFVDEVRMWVYEEEFQVRCAALRCNYYCRCQHILAP
jgi:glycerol-3-phosphate dehydrogenase